MLYLILLNSALSPLVNPHIIPGCVPSFVIKKISLAPILEPGCVPSFVISPPSLVFPSRALFGLVTNNRSPATKSLNDFIVDAAERVYMLSFHFILYFSINSSIAYTFYKTNNSTHLCSSRSYYFFN